MGNSVMPIISVFGATIISLGACQVWSLDSTWAMVIWLITFASIERIQEEYGYH